MKRAPLCLLALLAACGRLPAAPSAPASPSASGAPPAAGPATTAVLAPRTTFDLPPPGNASASLADAVRAPGPIVVGTIAELHAFTRPCEVDLVVEVDTEMSLRGQKWQVPERHTLFLALPRAAADKPGCERKPLGYRGAPAATRLAVGDHLVFFVGERREVERDPTRPHSRWNSHTFREYPLTGNDLLGVADVDEIPAVVRQRGPLVTDAQLVPLAAKPSFRVQGDVAIDTRTGLAWRRDVASTTLGIASANRHCEDLVFGGHDDWRLPRFFEVLSAVDHGRGSPALDPAVFRGPTNGLLWSGTDDAGAAWVLDVADGNLHSTHYDDPSPYGHYNVRCVRSAEGPSLRAALPGPRYRKAADGQLEDTLQRLAFSGTISKPMRFAEAITFCAAKVEAGRDDFRLPTVRELVSLSEANMAGDEELCDEVWHDDPEGEDGLWSATLDPENKDHAFRVRSLCSPQSWTEPTVGPPALAREGEDHARFRALCVRDLPPLPSAGAEVRSRYPSGHVFIEGALRKGKRHGAFTYHHDQGPPWKRLLYRDGVLEGAFTMVYDSGERRVEGAFAAGAPAGTWTHFDMLGRRESVVSYERGLRSGRSTTFAAGGSRPRREETWAEGLRHGQVIEYDEESGAKARVTTYVRGLREGAFETFDRAGSLSLVGQYHADEPEGTFSRFHPNGTRAAVFSFRDGELDGVYESWHPDGKPHEKGTYREGLREGRWTALHPSGKSAEEGDYKGGTGTLRSYYENGKVRHEQPQVGGLREGVTVFFREDGSKESEVGFSRDNLHGVYRYYDPTGKLTLDRPFDRGREHGPHVRFHPNGKKAEEGAFAQGRQVGPYRRWDEEGNLSEEGTFQDGLRHGTWTDFYRGKPVRRQFYERGVEVRDAELLEGR